MMSTLHPHIFVMLTNASMVTPKFWRKTKVFTIMLILPLFITFLIFLIYIFVAATPTETVSITPSISVHTGKLYTKRRKNILKKITKYCDAVSDIIQTPTTIYSHVQISCLLQHQFIPNKCQRNLKGESCIRLCLFQFVFRKENKILQNELLQ